MTTREDEIRGRADKIISKLVDYRKLSPGYAHIINFEPCYEAASLIRDLLSQLDQAREEIEKLKNFDMPNRISIHGMFDCHCFQPISGNSIEEVIANWLELNSKPFPAVMYGEKRDDLGPTDLCPAILLRDDKEIRRVGNMVHVKYDGSRKADQEDIDAYIAALRSDPDVERLLSERKP